MLGGKVISSSNNTYSYRSLFDVLLNYGEEAKNTQLEMGLFTKDTPNHMDEVDTDKENVGLNRRFEFTKNSKNVHLMGRVHSDLFHQGRFLINGLPLRLIFHRSKDSFILLSGKENPTYRIRLTEATLCVRRVELTPEKFREINQTLATIPILYPINRVVVKTHSMAAGLMSLNWDNAILGQIPNRVILGMVDNDAYAGSYKKNPFNLKKFSISSVGVFVNGESLPAKPLKLNFEQSDFLDGYRSLFTCTGKINRDEGVGISISDYAHGYTLFGFDLTPAFCNGAHQEIIKKGNVRIVLDFSTPLTRTITLVAYCDYDNIITVDKTRNVLTDF